MKHIRFSILLLCAVLITASCKKVPVIDYLGSRISYQIEGAPKEVKGDKNVFALYSKELTIMQITGNMDGVGDQQIALLINNFQGVGEYTVAEENFLAFYNSPELDQTVASIEGKIKVTEYIEGKSIKGEFAFKGEVLVISTDPNQVPEYKNFTEGKFQAKVTADADLEI